MAKPIAAPPRQPPPLPPPPPPPAPTRILASSSALTVGPSHSNSIAHSPPVPNWQAPSRSPGLPRFRCYSTGTQASQLTHTHHRHQRPSPPPVPIARLEFGESQSGIIRPTPRYAITTSRSERPSSLAWRSGDSTPPKVFIDLYSDGDNDDQRDHGNQVVGDAGLSSNYSVSRKPAASRRHQAHAVIQQDKDECAEFASPEGIVSNFALSLNARKQFGATTEKGSVLAAYGVAVPSEWATKTPRYLQHNQDCYCIYAPFPDEPAAAHMAGDVLLGIFDGHGDSGRHVAHFARAHLKDALIAAMPRFYSALLSGVSSCAEVPFARAIHTRRWKMFTRAFEKTEKAMRVQTAFPRCAESGTTALVALVSGRELYVAWVGHSRCVVGRKWTRMERLVSYDAIELSRDHTRSSASEMKRIRCDEKRLSKQRKAGHSGEVRPRKLNKTDMSLTRSLGDRQSQFGSISEPEVTYLHLCDDDSFMIVASHGIWAVLTNQEAVNIVGRTRNEGGSAERASEELVRQVKRRIWKHHAKQMHDMTAVVMWLGEDERREREQSSVGQTGTVPWWKKARRRFSFKKSSDDRSETWAVCRDGSLKPFTGKSE